MSEDTVNFMGYMWIQKEDGVITVGINEEGLQDFDEITSIELPPENEKVEADTVIGTIETDDGPLDIYAPVNGTILEINPQVLETPSLIQEDPYDEGWLLRIETTDDEDEDEDDYEDEDEDDDEEDSSDEDDE
ncbi:MAG: glycine cleavage system protein H [Bdellovibrionaceae bacterium]|nr:glycine cleavage system protein H [Pseudobdellovibrionaceae bacterium]